MPKGTSIKEAVRVLGGRLVIGNVPKLSNKDNPDFDQPKKTKSKLKLQLL